MALAARVVVLRFAYVIVLGALGPVKRATPEYPTEWLVFTCHCCINADDDWVSQCLVFACSQWGVVGWIRGTEALPRECRGGRGSGSVRETATRRGLIGWERGNAGFSRESFSWSDGLFLAAYSGQFGEDRNSRTWICLSVVQFDRDFDSSNLLKYVWLASSGCHILPSAWLCLLERSDVWLTKVNPVTRYLLLSNAGSDPPNLQNRTFATQRPVNSSDHLREPPLEVPHP